MLWEVEIRPAANQRDREGARVLRESHAWGAASIGHVQSARSFLIEGPMDREAIEPVASSLLVDTLVESYELRELTAAKRQQSAADDEARRSGERPAQQLLNVLFKPGVTDNVAQSTKLALNDLGLAVEAVSTCRKYWLNSDATQADLELVAEKILANDAIEQVHWGPLEIETISLGRPYEFELLTVALRDRNDEQLTELSRSGQLFLNLVEMQTIRQHFDLQQRDPTDIELETIAQTWSEHCSHKTLAGRIHYRDEKQDRQFANMLRETIFAATATIRKKLGGDDWCVSVFEDNAGIVKFDERHNVCIKVETHNHPSALEPYGGANTGLGGVIRDPLGTGLGAKPICNTDVFCFAPPETPYDDLPPGVLHPKIVAKGVVAGVRDYGNRMGIPTVNGAVLFDERYLGNPLVYCGNVAIIPVDKCHKQLQPGDLIVTVGGRTGRDGIHGATFSSAELTEESESLSGGAVQIGNAITEKMMADVILDARDRGLYSAITDCGAGGFSSAVGEMGAETGAEVWLERAPLKYAGLSYTEIWISEAQERMVLAVPPQNWDELHRLCAAEGVEATVIGEFQATGRLVLKYRDRQVAGLAMSFLHEGRPAVVREAVYEPPKPVAVQLPHKNRYDDDLKQILGSLNVCSKEWVTRQYDHEVQGGSVIKPLVGVENDGPSDAAVVRPDLTSSRGLVISCGMNPRFGDLDPYWMAASAVDEAIRNNVAVGANPARIAVLDNFCWGNTDRPEVLGSLVRAALGCHDAAVAYQTPFVSGKDSLNNEFSYTDADGNKQNVTIPPSLLISALGQMDDVNQAVSMDLKEPGNLLYLIGPTHNELGGSHYAMVNGLEGGNVPRVDMERAPETVAAVHEAICRGLLRSCHDLSEGGLAVAAAEMAFAGGLGIELDLKQMAAAREFEDAVLLFSESNTRFLIEVPQRHERALRAIFGGMFETRLPLVKLGHVAEHDRVQIRSPHGAVLIDSAYRELKETWQRPLRWE